MLTEQLLKQNVEGLSPEQIAAITELSKNDERKVIGQETARIHSQYDEDVARITGQAKPDNVKSYAHLSNVLTDLVGQSKLAEKAKSLQTKIATLETEKADLEERIKAGTGDQALKDKLASVEKKLADKEAEVTKVRSTYDAEKKQWEAKLAEERSGNLFLEFSQVIDRHLVDAGVKFKAGIPEKLLRETLDSRKKALFESSKPERAGQDNQMVFRDADGEIRYNPENKLQPFGAGELYMEVIGDLVDGGRQQSGTGSKGGGTGGVGGGTTTLDMTGVKSQFEANQKISKYLMAKGLTKRDPKFAEEQTKLYEEHNVSELPIREGNQQ